MYDYVYPCRSLSYHGVPAAVYHDGWAQNGAIVSPHKVEGIELHLRYQGTEAGPLFWHNTPSSDSTPSV